MRMLIPVLLFILLVTATILTGWYLPMPWSWFLIAAVMVAFLGALGVLTKRRWWGILIDERNKMSLSRFQMVLWTVLILSAYLAIVLQRIKLAVPDAVAVGLPPLLWALMGISTTSLVGSPLIKDTKRDKDPTDQAVRLAAAKLLLKEEFEQLVTAEREAAELVAKWSQAEELTAEWSRAALLSAQLVAPLAQAAPKTLVDPVAKAAARAVDNALAVQSQLKDAREAYLVAHQRISDEVDKQREGILCVNPQYADASFTDIFTGEEINNCGRLELGKVQMFYFTLVAIVSYAVALFGEMAANVLTPDKITAFPVLPEGLVALLTISHAGYLAAKAVDRTQTGPQN